MKDGMSDGWLIDAAFEGNRKKRRCFPASFTRSFSDNHTWPEKYEKIHVAEKWLELSQVIYICKFYFHDSDFNNKNAEAFDKWNRS